MKIFSILFTWLFTWCIMSKIFTITSATITIVKVTFTALLDNAVALSI